MNSNRGVRHGMTPQDVNLANRDMVPLLADRMLGQQKIKHTVVLSSSEIVVLYAYNNRTEQSLIT